MSGQKSKSAGLDEFEIIAEYFAPLSLGLDGAVGLSDDGAVLDRAGAGGDEHLAVTTDTFVAGVHYLADTRSQLIAQKLLRVNLSDLAAMGARPYAYNLSLALNDRVDSDWLAGFARGLAIEQENWGIGLVGGDTVRTPGPVTLTVSMFGHLAPERRLLRSGAQPGDAIYVSGTIGDASLGLQVLDGKIIVENTVDAAFLKDRHYLPTPRISLSAAIAAWASAGIDISDGLVADLGHICAASKCGAEIRLEDIPFSDSARKVIDRATEGNVTFVDLLGGGDDYELLFVVPADEAERVEAVCADDGTPVARIGTILGSEEGIRVVDRNNQTLELKSRGYRHF